MGGAAENKPPAPSVDLVKMQDLLLLKKREEIFKKKRKKKKKNKEKLDKILPHLVNTASTSSGCSTRNSESDSNMPSNKNTADLEQARPPRKSNISVTAAAIAAPSPPPPPPG